jgi:Domain of unknown function (DUF1772)
LITGSRKIPENLDLCASPRHVVQFVVPIDVIRDREASPLALSDGENCHASLVVVGGVSGLVAFLTGLDWRWLLGAVVVLANWPYTIFVIMPTNNRLMNRPPDEATDETRRMIGRWGMLHAGRSAFGLAATLIFLWGQR